MKLPPLLNTDYRNNPMSTINQQILDHFTDERIFDANYSDDDLRSLRDFAIQMLQQSIQLRENSRNCEARVTVLVKELDRLQEQLNRPTVRQMAWDLLNSQMQFDGSTITTAKAKSIIDIFNDRFPIPVPRK